MLTAPEILASKSTMLLGPHLSHFFLSASLLGSKPARSLTAILAQFSGPQVCLEGTKAYKPER